jgi:hypothetical protein
MGGGEPDAGLRDIGGIDVTVGDAQASDLGQGDLDDGVGADLGPMDWGTPDMGAPEMGTPDMSALDMGRSPCDPAIQGCICPPGELACRFAASCRELRDVGTPTGDGLYTLDGDGEGGREPAPAHCDMTSDGGGWTLVLKVDGRATTFGYDSDLWTNEATMGTPDFDVSEAKTTAFLNVRFSEVRLLFDTARMRRSLIVPIAAASIRDLIAGERVVTTAMRSAWLNLVPDSRLQGHCNAQGFNVAPAAGQPRVRIGLLANEQRDCDTPDSWVGVGGWHYEARVTAGNVARYAGAGNDRTIASFVYVQVR